MGKVWSTPGMPYRTKRVILLFKVVGAAMIGAAALVLSKSATDRIDSTIAFLVRKAASSACHFSYTDQKR